MPSVVAGARRDAREILLLDPPLGERGGERAAAAARVFAKSEDARGRDVEPVHDPEPRRRALPGADRLQHDVVRRTGGADAGRRGRHAARLVDRDQVGVLVEDRRRGRDGACGSGLGRRDVQDVARRGPVATRPGSAGRRRTRGRRRSGGARRRATSSGNSAASTRSRRSSPPTGHVTERADLAPVVRVRHHSALPRHLDHRAAEAEALEEPLRAARSSPPSTASRAARRARAATRRRPRPGARPFRCRARSRRPARRGRSRRRRGAPSTSAARCRRYT